MPTPTRPLARRKYTSEDVQQAMDAVRNNGMSITAAAKSFGIPKTTLQDKLKGRYREGAPLGRPTVLTADEEKMLETWIVSIAKAGFPVYKDQLLGSVAKLVKDLNRPNTFVDSVPGDKWYNLFLTRHKNVSERVAQALTSARSNVTEEQLKNWFAEVKAYIDEKGLSSVFDDPTRIFNADETAFFLCPKGKKVLARRGEKAIYSVTGNDEKECLTVLVTANAAGITAPPMVVYCYERIPAAIASNMPDEWGIGKSESGWMTGETFYEYVTNVFHPWLVSTNTPLPVVLFIDGHTSHLTKHLSDFCERSGIELVALYPNATHVIQPMDVAVFHPLKMAWKKTVQKWRFENSGRKMKREEFAPLLKEVFDSSLKKETIINGFRTTGIADLDANKLNFNNLIKNRRCLPKSESYNKTKLSEIQCHLNYLEAKIGLKKVRQFVNKEVGDKDESLYKVWQSIRDELDELKNEKKEELAVERVNVVEATVSEQENDEMEEREDEVMALREVGAFEERESELVEDEVLAIREDIVIEENEDDEMPGRGDGEELLDEILAFPLDDANSTLQLREDILQLSEGNTIPTGIIVAEESVQGGTSNNDVYLEKVASDLGLNDGNVFEVIVDVHNQKSTPQKQVNDELMIPSPFKRSLFWPEPSTSSASKKRRTKEKIPSVLTSKNYKLYLQKKEDQKKQKETEKEIRRLKKEANKLIKQEKDLTRKTKKIMSEKTTDDEEDEEDDVSSPKIVHENDLKNLCVSDWVVVPYVVNGEKDFFVGQIKRLTPNSAAIKFLSKRGNKYAWPEDDDIDNDVPITEVVQILSAPTVERRGFFTFHEKIVCQ